jgi:hypothetical protein
MANNYEKVTEKTPLGNRYRIITRRSQKKTHANRERIIMRRLQEKTHEIDSD